MHKRGLCRCAVDGCLYVCRLSSLRITVCRNGYKIKHRHSCFRMVPLTLTDFEWLSEIFSDTKHCITSLRQLSFLLLLLLLLFLFFYFIYLFIFYLLLLLLLLWKNSFRCHNVRATWLAAQRKHIDCAHCIRGASSMQQIAGIVAAISCSRVAGVAATLYVDRATCVCRPWRRGVVLGPLMVTVSVCDCVCVGVGDRTRRAYAATTAVFPVFCSSVHCTAVGRTGRRVTAECTRHLFLCSVMRKWSTVTNVP